MQALGVEHLDRKRGEPLLDAAWTKNRRSGFQPLPASLISRLATFADAGTAAKLYEEFNARSDASLAAPERPLLYAPSHPPREMGRDLKAAGIPKIRSGEKVDSHACRGVYVSVVLEAGESVEEAQTLARHSTPDPTLNTYATARERRLAEIAEKAAERAFSERECAVCVPLARGVPHESRRNRLRSRNLIVKEGRFQIRE